jgi:hypothetical protein
MIAGLAGAGGGGGSATRFARSSCIIASIISMFELVLSTFALTVLSLASVAADAVFMPASSALRVSTEVES